MQAESRMQAHVSHRGHYVVRVDATNILNPYDASVSRTPELVSIIMQDSVQVPVSSDTTANLGCRLTLPPPPISCSLYFSANF